jgi:hypothetical protein
LDKRQRSVVGEGAGAEIRYGHPDRIAHAANGPCGVSEVPQVERAIVYDAVIAANELHEAVIVPLLMMLVLLLVGKEEKDGLRKKEGSGLATARSDKRRCCHYW